MCSPVSTLIPLVIACSLFLPAFSETCGREASQTDTQDVKACVSESSEEQDDSAHLLMKKRVHVDRVIEGDSSQSNPILQGNGSPILPWSTGHVSHFVKSVLQVYSSSNSSDASTTGLIRKHNIWFFILISFLLLCILPMCILFRDSSAILVSEEDKALESHHRADGRPRHSPDRPVQRQSPSMLRSPQYVQAAYSTTDTSLHPAAPSSSTFPSPRPRSHISPRGTQPVMASSQASAPTMTGPVQSMPGSSSEIVHFEDIPSPICPSLTLPVCESRFAISMSEIHALTDGMGTMNIDGGLSGNILLKARVCRDGSGQRVEITTPEANALPRASIGYSQTKNLLDIRGLRGEYYGLLEIRSNGPCIVTRQGNQLMKIDGDPEELRLWITSARGKPLASAECTQQLGGADYVDIRVNPGMDTVLALALILAVLLFCPN